MSTAKNNIEETQIFSQLQKIMVELFELDPAKITMDAHLYNDLDIDSIDAVDLAVEVRELTGKRINPDDFKEVRTVGDLVATANKMLNS